MTPHHLRRASLALAIFPLLALGACASSKQAAPTCASSQKLCGGQCTSVQTDNANCGACGKACAAGEVCSGGTCGLSCGGGTTLCGSGSAAFCTNTDTDNANCGACGAPCAAGEVCAGGTCGLSCGGGTTQCGFGSTAFCTNTDTDRLNCGSCGNSCVGGCVDGVCQSYTALPSNGIVTWTAPHDGTYLIVATGADGGSYADASATSPSLTIRTTAGGGRVDISEAP